jgi:hypothetical protein
MKLSRVVLVGALCVASTAAADSKSWGALKGKLPAGTIIVGGADGTAIRATPSFPKVLDFLRSEDKDVGAMLDLVKTTCGMELPAMIGDISFAIDAKEKGVIVLSLSGTDQTKATDCVTKVLAKIEPKAKIATKVTGKITEYSVGPNDKLYAAWLAPDLVAISVADNSSAPLDAMLTGAAASGDLATYLGKTNPAAAGWVALNINDDGVKGGWATLALGKTVAVTLRLTAATPKDGDKARKEAKDAQKKGLDRSAKLPELKKVFMAMKIGGTGADVSVDVSVPESSIPALLPAFDKVF